MAYRYTDTNKWHDSWFSALKPLEKLLFNYLCDNCDVAGFIEIITKDWAQNINSTIPQIEGALKGLERGLIYSISNDCIYLRTFLKHQKNLPLNIKNQCHKGIISRFETYKYKFEITDIEEFIEGARKGLRRGYGNGNGNGNDKAIGNTVVIVDSWKNNFEIYKEDLKQAYLKLVTPEYLKRRQEFHPILDIKKTLAKAIEDYWIKESGWKNKKSTKTKDIDWEKTFNNSISNKMNWVYLPKK